MGVLNNWLLELTGAGEGVAGARDCQRAYTPAGAISSASSPGFHMTTVNPRREFKLRWNNIQRVWAPSSSVYLFDRHAKEQVVMILQLKVDRPHLHYLIHHKTEKGDKENNKTKQAIRKPEQSDPTQIYDHNGALAHPPANPMTIQLPYYFYKERMLCRSS